MRCTKTQLKLCGKCETCLNRSFASHEKAHCWSPKNKENPKYVFKTWQKDYLFDCDKCGHEFKSDMRRICYKGTWCLYCSSDVTNLCGNVECDFCKEKSFANEPMAKNWSDKNDQKPHQVSISCNSKFWFVCNMCGHDYTQKLNNITNNGQGCPYCSKTFKKICFEEDCKKCYNASFASHKKAKYWSFKNKVPPRHVLKATSRAHYWFDGKCGHTFKLRPDRIYRDNYWCPFCVNKTEVILKEFLEKKFEISTQNKFDWCINQETNKKLPFDFYIPERNVLIELDGAQHFRQISKWKDPDSTRYTDVFKMKQALDNGIRIIRLLQEDVISTRLNDVWQKRLIEAIESDDLVTYITCKEKDKDIYECHQEELEYELKET